MQSVLACRSQLVQLTQRDRSPPQQIWFDTVFQEFLQLVLLFSININSAIFLPFLICHEICLGSPYALRYMRLYKVRPHGTY